MRPSSDQSVSVPTDNKVIQPLPHRERGERMIQFYRSKFHYIVIPVGIIFAAVHLKFGVQYLGKCTIQPMINIYMIVHASVTVLIALIAIIGVLDAHCIYSRFGENPNNRFARRLALSVGFVTLILVLFSLAWLVTGSVWVFSAKRNGVQGSDATLATTYCPSDLYKAAFLLIIMNYIVHGIIIWRVAIKTVCRKTDPSA